MGIVCEAGAAFDRLVSEAAFSWSKPLAALTPFARE
jgi:hypothetical protein